MAGRAVAVDALDAFVDLIAERVAERIGTAAPATSERKLVSVKEAADVMGVSEKSFRHRMYTKDFPEQAIRRFGRKILIERVTLERWLATH